MSDSETLFSIPPHFVAFAWRYPRCDHFFAPQDEGRVVSRPRDLCLVISNQIISGRAQGLPGSWRACIDVPKSPTPVEPLEECGPGLLQRWCLPGILNGRPPRLPRFRGSMLRPIDSLSTLRRSGYPDPTQDSLPGGGPRLPGRDSNPQGSKERFQQIVTSCVPLSQASPGAQNVLGRLPSSTIDPLTVSQEQC